MFKQSVFPRWRGFNLLGMFCSDNSPINQGRAPGYYIEDDFKMISDLGFDFVRLPLSYRVWGNGDDVYFINEEKLAPLDKAVEWGNKYGIHINVCMHRLPGYCINDDEHEKLDLWTSEEALGAARGHWKAIAKRYIGIDSSKLSFNVMNEVNYKVRLEQYMKVSKGIISAVREITPDRLFIIDGLNDGDMPPIDQMFHLENCGYSCRCYAPRGISHYKHSAKSEYDNFPPIWPGAVQIENDGTRTVWNREKVDRYFDMFAALSQSLHVGVHCGEMGCYCNTPHDATLAWFDDVLSSMTERNIGYAIWNFRGKFGVLDSERADVDYVNYAGHKLDKKLLDLLQKY